MSSAISHCTLLPCSLSSFTESAIPLGSDRFRSRQYAMQLTTYATLSAFRQRQALAASDTGDDDRMLAKLRSATAQIDRFTGRSFIPTVATRKFNWHNARTLLFRGYDLLELTRITNGDGTSVDPTAIIQ